MKIVFDGLIYYLQKRGGISRYFDELIESFSNREDCEVIVLMRKNKIDKKFNNNVKIEIVNSVINTDNRIKKYISIFRDKYAVNNFLKKQNYSNLIFHYSYYSHYKNLKVKSVVTVHDLVHEKFPNFFKGFLNKLYLANKKKSINKAGMIIAISEQTKKDLIDIYGVESKKIEVVYHGLSKNFKPLSDDIKKNFIINKNISKPFFIFVGNRSLYKNFSFMLKSFSSWEKHNDFIIYCLGGGEFNEEERNLISFLKLDNNIKLFPSVSEEELIYFYNCASALIFPSLYEGFGFPLLESMACGTVTLVSDIPVFKEIGQNVPLYFNPNIVSSLVDIFDSFIEIDNERIQLGLELVKKYKWNSNRPKRQSRRISRFKRFNYRYAIRVRGNNLH